MSESEILEQIKQAESDARAMVEQAYSDKRKAIMDARTEAREIIDNAEERARDHADHLLDTERKKISEERQGIIEQGEADAASLKETASMKIGAAVDFLLEEFVKVVHAKAETDE